MLPFGCSILSFTLTWLVVFMPMVHIVPFAIDMGISPFRAAMTISVIGLAGSGGRLVSGTLSDRFGRVVSLGTCFLLQALSFAGFTISSKLVQLYMAAAVFGFSYGGVTALFPALVGDFLAAPKSVLLSDSFLRWLVHRQPLAR
jgi:MFS family permease